MQRVIRRYFGVSIIVSLILSAGCSTTTYKTGDLSFSDMQAIYTDGLIEKYEYAKQALDPVMTADAERFFHQSSEALQTAIIENYTGKHPEMLETLLQEFTRLATDSQARMLSHAFTMEELKQLAYALPVLFEKGTGYESDDTQWQMAGPALAKYRIINHHLTAYSYTRANSLLLSNSRKQQLTEACLHHFKEGDDKKALPACIQDEFIHGTSRLLLGEIYRRQEPIEGSVFLSKAVFTKSFVLDKNLEGLFYHAVLSVMYPVDDLERDLGYCGLKQAEMAGHKKAAEAARQALEKRPEFAELNCELVPSS